MIFFFVSRPEENSQVQKAQCPKMKSPCVFTGLSADPPPPPPPFPLLDSAGL